VSNMASDADSIQLMTVSEVAQLIGVSRVTIHRWAKNGKFDSVKVGNLLLMPMLQVKKLAEQRGSNGLQSVVEDIVARRKKGWVMKIEQAGNDKIYYLEVKGPNGEQIKAELNVVEQYGFGDNGVGGFGTNGSLSGNGTPKGGDTLSQRRPKSGKGI